jgi:hypothetical protein
MTRTEEVSTNDPRHDGQKVLKVGSLSQKLEMTAQLGEQQDRGGTTIMQFYHSH